MITAGILLAAGTSQRFGRENKLLVDFKGRPLIAHAAAALRASEPDALIAVIADEVVAAELADFQCVRVGDGQPSKSRSLRAGILAARELGADRALIALGDMPAVTPEHLAAVAARCTDDTPAATRDGARAMVPACFPRSYFPALLALEGDTGARALLAGLPVDALVSADAAQLLDVDTLATSTTGP